MDARDLDASLSVHMMKVGGDLAPFHPIAPFRIGNQ